MVASQRVLLAPSIIGCFAPNRDGVVDCSHASRARESARASRAVAHLSRCSLSRRQQFVASSRHSRLHLGVCLWPRRCSVASLLITTAWWTARAPLALAYRLAPPAPSHVSPVARRNDGDDLLHPRAIHGFVSACASGAVDLLRLLPSPLRRCGGLIARLSCSHVGLRLQPRCASLSLLAVTTAMICCILAPFTIASRRVPLEPSALFGCFARHRDGVLDRSRASRARVSACASRAVARLSRGSSLRRKLFVALSRHSRLLLSVCLWRRRSSVASFVTATAWWTAHASLVPASRLAHPVPSRVSRVARRYDGNDSLHPRAIRDCISACASGPVDLQSLCSSSRRRDGLLERLSRSRVGSRLPRRCASLSLLVVTTAMIRCILAPFAIASRRVPLAPSIFSRFPRHRCISACASGAVDPLRLLRASLRRRGKLIVRLSCSRVG